MNTHLRLPETPALDLEDAVRDYLALRALAMRRMGASLGEIQADVNEALARLREHDQQLEAEHGIKMPARWRPLTFTGSPDKPDYRLAARLVKRGEAILGTPRADAVARVVRASISH